MSVLIVASAADPQAHRVADALVELNEETVWCDAPAFPEQTLLSIKNGRLRLGPSSLSTPKAAYVRDLENSPLAPKHRTRLRERPEGVSAQCEEVSALLESYLHVLERKGARLVNSPKANEQRRLRPYQLEVLHSRDIPVPRWLATNNPAAVRRFVGQVGRVLMQPLSGGAHGRLLDENDLDDFRMDALGHAPALFREFNEGAVYRAFVVGKSVVAIGEIAPMGEDAATSEQGMTTGRLKGGERKAAEAAARACHMHFAAVDVLRIPGGFRILGCDPMPDFAAFESATGADIASPLAHLLVY